MKKILTLSAALMLGVFFMAGCSKSSSSSPSYSMKATVGSTAFSQTNSYAVLYGTQLSITANAGTASAPNPPTLGLMIQNYTGPGPYTVNTSSATAMVTITWGPTSNVMDEVGASSGTITITSASSSSYVGTFSGTLTNGTAVTGGTFTARKM